MWTYVIRRIVYFIPVYLGIIFLVMVMLRVNDPTTAYLGKNASFEEQRQITKEFGLDDPLIADIRFGGRRWVTNAGGYHGDYLTKRPWDGRTRVEWRGNVTPGQYRIEMTWPARLKEGSDEQWVSVGDSQSVFVTIREAHTPERQGEIEAEVKAALEAEQEPKLSQEEQESRFVARAVLDQTKLAGPVDDQGIGWQEIATRELLTGDFVIRLVDEASGSPIADAIRLVPIGGDGEVLIVDNADDAVSVTNDPWSVGGFLKSLTTSQYATFIWSIVTLDLSERSWEIKRPVGELIASAIPPTLFITVPSLVITATISIGIGLVCSFQRGRWLDRSLMILAVLGMSVSYLVYIIIGQYFGAFVLSEDWGIKLFEIHGYEKVMGIRDSSGAGDLPVWWNPRDWLLSPGRWVKYCMLPVLIGVIVAMGYDTRFYRAVMVEESGRDYIITARAKGATAKKIMFVHMLKNAMIPIITRVMITLPFLITGSILVEMYFGIPGMGRTMITAINSKDFPIVQATVAFFAGVVILTVILTDVLYALVDPRVRLT